MEDALADLFSVDDLVDFSVNGEFTGIVLLTTGSWVEGRLIENDDVSVGSILEISEDFEDRGIEFVRLMVVVVQVDGFFDVSGLV